MSQVWIHVLRTDFFILWLTQSLYGQKNNRWGFACRRYTIITNSSNFSVVLRVKDFIVMCQYGKCVRLRQKNFFCTNYI